VLLGGHIYRAFAEGSGFFQHGHTYIGHPLACAAGLAVQQTIRCDGLLANVRDMGTLLQRRLGERFGNHAHVGDIRGRGLFQAIELVEDRMTKVPFEPARRLHAKVKKAAMARGLMVYPMGGTIDGRRGDHVLLAPPFIVTAGQIDEIVDRLGSALDDALA
jgi:adenosylmethionine-8-amino-7-oxononanoate aminotransferase